MRVRFKNLTGYDRWEYHRYGCTIEHVVQGTTGVLISQDCHHVICPDATGARKFCGNGQQLLLRDGIAGSDSKEQGPEWRSSAQGGCWVRVARA